MGRSRDEVKATRNVKGYEAMKWRGRRGSRNVVDRRRAGGAGRAAGLPVVGVLAIVAVGYFLGIDVTPLLQDGAIGGGQGNGQPVELTEADKRAGEFVSVTLADTEEVWTDVFRQQVDGQYVEPKLVLFKGATQSACGGASAASGPFYCPGDNQIYLDTDFFTTMERRLGAKGDFAAAYVVAHEVAHHVQNVVGTLGRANARRQQVSQRESNEISVRVELQADCYAGIWARQVEAKFGTIEPGDIAEAVNTARQIGDDTLQRNAGRTVQPHTFTHGTSEQRVRWFKNGYVSGRMVDCDTFGG